MKLSQVQVGIFEYARCELIPVLDGFHVNLFGFNLPISKQLAQVGFGIATGMADLQLEKYLPALKMVGIANENGDVNVEKFCDLLATEFDKLGEPLKIGGFKFDKTDIEKLRGYLG